VPQVCVLFGPSPAGSAYVPALCDVVIMVRGHATAYIGSPRLAEMVTGERVSLEEMGGAEMHCRESGLGDVLVDDDTEAIAAVRVWLSYLPSSWREEPPATTALPPAPPGRPLEDIVPVREDVPFDVNELVEAIVDESTVFPYKELFAPELVCGFARLGGRPVGLLANQSLHKAGVLFSDSSDKAARFIWICNAFNVPLLFLADNAGYMIGTDVERRGIIRHGAKMLFAVSEASVPKVTVVLRKAYGAGYFVMNGTAYEADYIVAWPTAEIAVMGPDGMVNIIMRRQLEAIPEGEQRTQARLAMAEELRKNIDPYIAAGHAQVDAIIDPAETRAAIVRGLRVSATKTVERPWRKHGVLPV